MLMLALLYNTASVTSLLCQAQIQICKRVCAATRSRGTTPSYRFWRAQVSDSKLHSSAKIHLKTVFEEHNNKNQ